MGVDREIGKLPVHNDSTCDLSCPALAPNEWLANSPYWSRQGTTIVAIQDTLLKKSIANSQVLPDSELLSVGGAKEGGRRERGRLCA